MITRRLLLTGGAIGLAAVSSSPWWAAVSRASDAFEVTHSDTDWRKGWPSFWAPLDKAVGTTQDTSFGVVRTAVHCIRCGGHLGHVFEDGPKPTGLRYCMNGVAMIFKSATT